MLLKKDSANGTYFWHNPSRSHTNNAESLIKSLTEISCGFRRLFPASSRSLLVSCTVHYLKQSSDMWKVQRGWGSVYNFGDGRHADGLGGGDKIMGTKWLGITIGIKRFDLLSTWRHWAAAKVVRWPTEKRLTVGMKFILSISYWEWQRACSWFKPRFATFVSWPLKKWLLQVSRGFSMFREYMFSVHLVIQNNLKHY